MTPFDFINAISNKGQITWSDDVEKDYGPFMVNRGLGYFPDTVLMANQMNIMSHLDKKMQYDFLYGAIKKGKRFSKWDKAPKDDVIDLICEVYKYSKQYASTIVDIFTPEQLEELKARTNKGGMK